MSDWGRLLAASMCSVCSASLLACGARSDVGGEIATSDGGVDDGIAGDGSASCAPSTPTVLATASAADGFVGSTHVADGFVYWLQIADGPADSWNGGKLEHIGTVYRVATSGGAVQPLVTFGIRSDRVQTPLVGFDETSVYWAADPIGKGPGETDGAIMRANLDGTNPTTVVGGLNHPAGVAVAAGVVFFDVVDSLERANVDGTNVQLVDASGVRLDAGAFAISSQYLYYLGGFGIVRAPTTGGQFSTLVSVPWDGGLIGSPTIVALSLDGDTGLAITSVLPAPTAPPPVETLVRWSTSGGELVPLVTGFSLPSSPPGTYAAQLSCTASDGTMAYFDSSDAIVRVPLAGGAPQTVGPTAVTGGIGFDAERVYWTSLNGQTLSVYSVCK